MNCLLDYVGIRGYHVAPVSGQFINQLPGISLKDIQLTANSEQVTFVAVWVDVQERAWRRISGDFLIAMRGKYCLTEETNTDDIICADKALFLNAWLYLLGAELMDERLFTDRINKLTTVDRERGLELKDMFTGLYENALEDLMPAVKWKEQTYELTRSYHRVERLP